MKKSIVVLILAIIGLFSCKEESGSRSTFDHKKKNIKIQKTLIYSKYQYADSFGSNLIVENSFPKGGMQYTAPNGKIYNYAIFWTRISNNTTNPIELQIYFPLNSFEIPNSRDDYFKIVIPKDVMTPEKVPLFNYGLTNLESFLNHNIDKMSSMRRTIASKESVGFYVVVLRLRSEAHGILRTEFYLKKEKLFYKMKAEGSKNKSESFEKDISCGSISLKNLVLQK